MKNRSQRSLFETHPDEPETQPLFEDWRYDLPDEPANWRRAVKEGILELSEQELEALEQARPEYDPEYPEYKGR